MIIGVIAAIISGVDYPMLAFLFGKISNKFIVPTEQYPEMHHNVSVIAGYFVLLGGLSFMIFLVLIGTLSYHTQALTREIRKKVFSHYLSMDISFFDKEENSPGALVSIMAKDSQDIQGFGGTTLGQILHGVCTVLAGVIMAIAINWRLGLVCTACVPIILCCGFLRVFILIRLEEKTQKVYADSAQYACESVGAIRTVASLTQEDYVLKTYGQAVESKVKRSQMSLLRSAILFGLGEGLFPAIMALGFWYGSTLIRRELTDLYAFFTAFVAIVFGVQSAGQVFSFATVISKSKVASENVLKIFDIKPTIDCISKDGKIMEDVSGNITFSDIHFRYPSRLHVPVLRGLSLSIQSGKYIGLVGSSGCGKSTIISLIEQFYRPISGTIYLDGVDITTLNVAEYRNLIGLVQQEPVLFQGTIEENILLGLSEKDYSQGSFELHELMYDAAKKANIHDFIMSLPEGYQTDTGSKGSLLSGGQKQRVAIARALIRNPKILLLDEATSALDGESEKVVQAAIDQAAKGRTTIAVAHRLSTIKNADVIYVIDKGIVVEQGTHTELIGRKGIYYKLAQMQALETAEIYKEE